ncbi:hypothetical protein QA601_13380 [Chitinispirillales bacterium ANBcel5]|uniref:glucosamine inositolphosphorylceramide transferase family protein n=1 Tax=Cellulosispirillum alkaliphilum TaxID=3039283 RepID=UPI002A4FC5F1|nr:hypothetical protein [Chitinispirillales bacterium ANBcel5]
MSRKKGKRLRVLGLLIILLLISLSFFYWNQNKSRVNRFTKNNWAIGIYTGPDPFTLSSPPHIENPVLTADDITDIKADYVADPFMIKKDSLWYMFFEVKNSLTNHSDIGLAVSRDGFSWEYERIVLDEPFHLSYPLVFLYKDEYYMIPESAEAMQLLLYRAKQFPYSWEVEKVLIEGEFGDHVLFKHDATWWLIANSSPYTHDNTKLFFADSLKGTWTEHPQSPIVISDASRARPGGRVPALDGTIYWFAQDCYPTYGRKLNAFKITELTRENYSDIPHSKNPVLQPGAYDWTRRGMHHIDAHKLPNEQWIACVDGYSRSLFIEIEY